MRQPLSPGEGEGDPDDTNPSKDGPRFQPGKTSERLNQIDRVRANGVGYHVALPQLVVCGDHSAGKSSVLEGISGYPFPRQDGTCTQFPTEIVLRHHKSRRQMAVSLLPCPSRSSEEMEQFAALHREFQEFSNLPRIIQKTSSLMGLCGFSEFADAPDFAADVLRLELVGDTGLHLTLVDIPGLISVSEDDGDVEMVQSLVDSYVESSRTIILAVIPASSDAETQRIIQRARHFDRDGPDLINKDTEERVARLAKNLERTRLNLGFFLLKNPSPAQLAQGMNFLQRRRAELELFSSGPWRAQGLNPSRVGIDNLRSFLADLLDSHIERKLPRVQDEVRRLLQHVGEEIDDLGIERSNPSQIRIFLTRISTDFQCIIKTGLEGNYDGPFADHMRCHGQRRRVITNKSEVSGEEWEEDDDGTEELLVTEKQMSTWIKEMYHQSRGRELPGNYNNHSLLQGLFHTQSSRWGHISRRHVDSVVGVVTRFVDSALQFVVRDEQVRQNLRRIIRNTLNENVQKAHQELARLLHDEQGHPITYNHNYSQNMGTCGIDAENDRF
ncbi:hypothetical protein ASPFODRAFT_60190 [Aspergillus luchuensis CBS 106.47]|uniref:Dynamin GTPase domain-containing protein n=1 Tax=Aspergillus luchuensis (strain CBS 106.47) TaxID=1137211 RepID=A0A1M3TLX1_ASPLC|nr:hypothetical protein ASPFODRAFT_60190 [Aspergillus luchuensis CBS 106.47]